MEEDHSEDTPEANSPEEAASEAPATPLDARVPKKRWYRRVRWRVVVARVVLWGIVGAAALSLVLYTAVRIFVKADDIRKLVKDLVEEQTGGKMDIGQAEFHVLSGVKLSNVQFYPPAAGDTRGFKYGGEINPVPLANFEALDVQYSIPKLFAAKVHLKALQLIGPEFHLKQTDGVFNFDPILKYREVKFPPEPEKPEEKKVEDAEEPGNALLPFSPALIYMPVELLTQNIGIKNLRLDMIKEEKGKITQIVMTNGLSFDCGVHWFGRKSNIWFDMTSPFERPLELSVQDAARNEQGEATGDLKQSVLVKTALVLHFAFENLQKINMDFATRLLTVETPVAGYQDIGTLVKMRLAIADDYKSINFDTFDLSLGEAMAYELRGNVAIPSGNVDVINLKLKQKYSLDLKEAAKLAKPFVPGLTAQGEISFDDLKIEGSIEPAKLANIDKGIALPYVSGVIWLEDVAATLAGLGVEMEPMSGDVSLAMGPSLNGAGSQVDLAVNMDIPKVEVEQTIPLGTVRAGVAGMTTKVTMRALWPEMIAPILKINAEAEHVTASGTGIAPLDVPLFADIDADGRADLNRLSFSSNVELTDLLEFSAMADCQAKCTKFRSSMNGRMDSLQKLHSIALPLGGVLKLTDVMPTKLTGAVDFQVSARGKLPDPTLTPPLDIIKQADLRFNSQFNLAKLNADVPLMDVKVKNFETRVLASGTLAEQKIDLSQKFESVSLALPPSPEQLEEDDEAKGMAVSVNRYSLETNVTNEIEGTIDLDKILKQVKTDVDTRLYIGKVAVEGGPLPRPVSDISVNVDLTQVHLEDIKLKEVVVKLPDFGTSVTVKADTSVGADFMPKKLWTKILVNVLHNGDERLPLGVKTSGKVDVNLEIDTKDMRNVAIDGETSFDRFNVMMPASDPKQPPLIEIEGMKGAIPFKQNIQIPDLASLKKPAEAPKPDAAQAAVQATAEAAKKEEATKAEAKKDEIPDVQVAADDDGEAEKADEKLDKLAGQYFTKNEDKLAASANPVATVDYPNIRPFYPERRPLSIERLEAANLELTKMEFDLELRQNFFAVNQFVIGFLGGKIQGDFQLAFDAAAKDIKNILLGLRTTVHMTRLDTRKLLERFPNLKDKTSSVFGFSNPYLDGTVHFKYDLKANDMAGGVEITSIGKEQLKMMLFYVDPFEQNPTISDMRKALSFGEVRQVSIPIKNGEIGIDVDVRLLSAPIPTPKLTRFPISQLIDNMKDQLLPKQEDKAPDAAPSQPAVPEVTPQVSGA